MTLIPASKMIKSRKVRTISLRKTVVHGTLSILISQLFILQTNVLSLTLPENSDDLLLPIHQVLPCCAVYEVLGKFSHKVATGGQKSCEPIFRLTQSLHLLFRSSNPMNTLLQLLTSVRVLQHLLPTRFFATRWSAKSSSKVKFIQEF